MPEEIDNFFDALNYYEAGDNVVSDPSVQLMLGNAQRLGMDILEKLQNMFTIKKTKKAEMLGDNKRKPPPPPGIVRTISESAFLEPKNITSLDEVTKPELKEYTFLSKIFNNTSYGVKDLTVTATYHDKNHNNTFACRAGDKVGFQYSHSKASTTYSVSLEQNLYSGRTRASYTVNGPLRSYGVSVYQKNGDIGATVNYSRRSGLMTSLSANLDGVALSAGYSHDFSDCKLTVRGFVSTQKRQLDTFSTKNYSALVGVCGTITVK